MFNKLWKAIKAIKFNYFMYNFMVGNRIGYWQLSKTLYVDMLTGIVGSSWLEFIHNLKISFYQIYL